MKPGRPSFHIKAKWIAWCKNGESTYYELDDKGNLIKSESDFIHVTHQTESNDKKKRKKRKNEVSPAESMTNHIQSQIEYLDEDKFKDELFKVPCQTFINDNSTLGFFNILETINEETTIFDQLFEF